MYLSYMEITWYHPVLTVVLVCYLSYAYTGVGAVPWGLVPGVSLYVCV